jgi:hypothetical protein
MNSADNAPASRERELFLQALERSTSAERAAFLDLACGQDTPLRRRLDLLLQRFGDIGSFLERPAAADLDMDTGDSPDPGSSAGRPAANLPGRQNGVLFGHRRSQSSCRNLGYRQDQPPELGFHPRGAGQKFCVFARRQKTRDQAQWDWANMNQKESDPFDLNCSTSNLKRTPCN